MPPDTTCSPTSKDTTIVSGSIPPSGISPPNRQSAKPLNPVSTKSQEGHPAWDQQEETEQSDSRTDRGRAIDTRVQSELVSSIVPRGTSLRWIVAPTVWRSSLRLSAPFPLSSGTRFHHSTCDA